MRTSPPRIAESFVIISLLLTFAACAGEDPGGDPATEAPPEGEVAPGTAPAPTPGSASGADDPVERGRYLTVVGGCHDCHTPKVMTGGEPVPDTTRLLSGHPQDATSLSVPSNVLTPDGWAMMGNAHATAWAGPWGISYAINLTPDSTGLGAWTEEQFIQGMRTGRHMGAGRPILPPMPWRNVGSFTDADLQAVFAYLQSIPAIQNAVPAPVPPEGGPPGGP